jgi:hypothetical protein
MYLKERSEMLKLILSLQLSLVTSSVFAQPPTCQRYGVNSSEVAYDKKSNQIVFFDQRTTDKRKFQVWNVSNQKLIKAGSLANQSNYILGFNNGNTITFAGKYDTSGMLTFGPIQRYNINNNTVTEVPIERTTGHSLTTHSLKAGIAIVRSERGNNYALNLKTGKMNFTYYDVQNSADGFSSDGLNFYSLIIPEFWSDSNSEISILKFNGPNFFVSSPEVITSIKHYDVGMILGANAQMYSSAKAISESGKSLALALEVYSDTGSGVKQFRKIMCLDTVSGQKTFCEVEFSRGPSKLQIVDEKQVLFQSYDSSKHPIKKLVNMTTCQSQSLPNMEGVAEDSLGHFISSNNNRMYYNRGGIWNLDTGATIFRTCE